MVCYTDRSKAVVPVLVLLFVALWFILRGDLLYVFPCVILFLCFSVLLVLRLLSLGKRELILALFGRLFGLCLFGFVGFLFLFGSGKGCGCDCGIPWTFLLPFFQRQTFSIWRPCWRPYWISRLAIIYANLCRQFQNLQTIGNILIYDTSCCTWGRGRGRGGSGLPLERVVMFF